MEDINVHSIHAWIWSNLGLLIRNNNDINNEKSTLTAIIISIITPLITITAQGPPTTPNKPPIPETPGMANAQQINKTDMTPYNFRYNFSAGTPQRLQFKNMVMEINATRTMNITSQEGVRIHYSVLKINIERNMHLNVHANASPPVDIPAPNVSINKYMNFESNTTEPMNVTLSFYLNQTEIEQELGHEFNKSRASWAFWNGTGWIPVESTLSENKVLEANTDHFSTWTIVETVETTEPDTEPSFIERIPIPASFVAIGLAGAALLSKKREQA
ncbi:hypothetical protein GF326_00090 [Candidatus Bathyarchaeota archaeon]|nr:hypothetical protein [Candidatus Bathyarchaeota archaeon]